LSLTIHSSCKVSAEGSLQICSKNNHARRGKITRSRGHYAME
jgi:hypothetical protein